MLCQIQKILITDMNQVAEEAAAPQKKVLGTLAEEAEVVTEKNLLKKLKPKNKLPVCITARVTYSGFFIYFKVILLIVNC